MRGTDEGVSEIERLQAALRETEAQLIDLIKQKDHNERHRQQLVAIVEASRDAIWSWTPDCIPTSWNGEAERLYQYRPEEIIGKSLLILVPPERMERAHAAIAKLRGGGWYDQYETVRLRKDGSRVPVELTVSPIRDDEGGLAGIATGAISPNCGPCRLLPGRIVALCDRMERRAGSPVVAGS